MAYETFDAGVEHTKVTAKINMLIDAGYEILTVIGHWPVGYSIIARKVVTSA